MMTFTMSKGEWVEIIENFNYFPIKFNDFDQINIGRITFDLFYQIFNKIYQSATGNQLQYINNRTYKYGFSTKW